MGQINLANLKKTVYFLRRNGFKTTCYEMLERLESRKRQPYAFEPPDSEKLAAQRLWAQNLRAKEGTGITFSILVPAYRTREKCLRELTASLLAQSYPFWELILADASEDNGVFKVLGEYQDTRIRYVRLERNEGISANTGRALELAVGAYIGLLDHDDVLTPDALYETAFRIHEERLSGKEPQLLYSDEDKCDDSLTVFCEPNWKEDFNLDLLLCNNYICHFMVMKRELMQKLGFRKEFDGAQDHDLVLRAAAELAGREDAILHIPKVLYHWRSHSVSTAENPWSKTYAYDAGRRAVQGFADGQGWAARAADMPNPGFYRLEYAGSPLAARQDLGAVGGRILSKGRIAGGRMGADGAVFYKGLPKAYSGYLHRAALQQDAEALDIRNLELREPLRGLFREIVGVPYASLPGTEKFDSAMLPDGADPIALSLSLSRAVRERGYRLLYIPRYLEEQHEYNNGRYTKL